MPSAAEFRPLSLEQFAAQCQGALVPVSNHFSYFQACPLGEEEVHEYIEEPIAALPPALVAKLPPVAVILVPYIEKPDHKEKANGAGPRVTFERPPENRQLESARVDIEGRPMLLFAIKDRNVADYHYFFYRAIASVAADYWSDEERNRFCSLLREELRSRVHGEVDQEAWHLKEALIRRQTNIRKETKTFQNYARQAYIDTLTLYLHGICCDIEVEPGPRQLPSRYLRKRLKLLEEFYPPPPGYAVFPEELSQIETSQS